jgi:hypothetical protein
VSKTKTRNIEESVAQVNTCFKDYDAGTLESLFSLNTSVLAEKSKFRATIITSCLTAGRPRVF